MLKIGGICGESCCTREVENAAYKQNQVFIEKYIRGSILKLSSIIAHRAKKFDEVFRDMMNTSKKEFHKMFERTYGKIYLRNSDVFSDFLGELETYYKKGTIRLSETMDTFFGILYQRMFIVINSQYNFDEQYLACVANHMTEMKPFGDVPHKLGIQLRRSFVATRTFYKSLIKGADATKRLAALPINEECFRESTKMRFCGLCRGEGGGLPCSAYCTNTMQNCFKLHMTFSNFWDVFIDAVDKVGDRLLGPYNIEVVVEPLNIKISEAIMNFQESGADISQKIYSMCGKPTFTRHKRGVDNIRNGTSGESSETVSQRPRKPKKHHGGKRKKHKKVKDSNESRTTTLERIIMDIKQKLKETKQFFINLPYQYCNALSLQMSTSINDTMTTADQCWNGTDGGVPQGPPGAFRALAGGSSILNEQLYVLQGLTDKLRKAHQGQEVEMADDTESDALIGGNLGAGSGSGSGDGGEDAEIDEEDDDEDHHPHSQHPPLEGGRGRSDLGGPSKDITFEEPEQPVVEMNPSTRGPEVVRTSGAAATHNDMSLTRALVQYLLPMVMVWFGGAVNSLL
nr:unnamed protein product [Callosobruchus chinensis]